MRIVPTIILFLGLGLVLTAVTLAFGGTGSDRVAAIDGFIESEAERYDNRSGPISRGERRWRGFVNSIADLNNGVLRGASVDFAAVLPPAPPGWTRAAYTTVDGAAITGETYVRTPLATTSANRTLGDFEDARTSQGLQMAVTYRSGDSMIALRAAQNLDAIRRAQETGTAPDRSRPTRGVVGTIDGLVVTEAPRIIQNHMNAAETRPAPFGQYRLALGGMVEVDLLTNGTTEDVMTLLSGLDLAAIQDALPVPIPGYVRGDTQAAPQTTRN